MFIPESEPKVSFTECILMMDTFLNGKDKRFNHGENESFDAEYYRKKGVFNTYCIKDDLLQYLLTKNSKSKENMINGFNHLMNQIDLSQGSSECLALILFHLHQLMKSIVKYLQLDNEVKVKEGIVTLMKVNDYAQEVLAILIEANGSDKTKNVSSLLFDETLTAYLREMTIDNDE